MENLKAGGIKYTRNKEHSPHSSGSKSKERSHSKSSKNFIKSHEQSAKNLHVFSNSGIKNKVTKNISSKDRLTSATSKKGNRDEDHEKLRKYMEEKKKKDRNDANKKAR